MVRGGPHPIRDLADIRPNMAMSPPMAAPSEASHFGESLPLRIGEVDPGQAETCCKPNVRAPHRVLIATRAFVSMVMSFLCLSRNWI
jgi:hypothetical protein